MAKKMCVCVCVCPLSNGWFLQVSNFRIVLVVQWGLRADRRHGCQYSHPLGVKWLDIKVLGKTALEFLKY